MFAPTIRKYAAMAPKDAFRRRIASSLSSVASPLVIPIELVSDTLCPNGYIGKRHLNRAIETVLSDPLPDASRPIKFSVIRVPFFLEPHYDESRPSIESNRERLIKKWGGVAGWEEQKRRHDLKGRGLEAGIPHFNLDRMTSNTMASHRLIQTVGKRYGLRVSEALYDRLNVYYFVDGHALNDRQLLAKISADEIAKQVSNEGGKDFDLPPPMREDEILRFLNGDEGRNEIEMALRALDDIGVHGIPKFIVEGSTVVDGAARSDHFVQIFRKIERRGEVAGVPIFAKILGIDDRTIQEGSHSAETIVNRMA